MHTLSTEPVRMYMGKWGCNQLCEVTYFILCIHDRLREMAIKTVIRFCKITSWPSLLLCLLLTVQNSVSGSHIDIEHIRRQLLMLDDLDDSEERKRKRRRGDDDVDEEKRKHKKETEHRGWSELVWEGMMVKMKMKEVMDKGIECIHVSVCVYVCVCDKVMVNWVANGIMGKVDNGISHKVIENKHNFCRHVYAVRWISGENKKRSYRFCCNFCYAADFRLTQIWHNSM